MGQPLGEFAIVCEKDQAFGLRVETTDAEEPGKFLWQKIENGVARMHIFSGRNEPRRFVQHDRQRRINMNKFAVHFYVISRGRLRAEVRANAAVDRDASSSDQLIAMPAGTDSSRGKEAIETHGGGKVCEYGPAIGEWLERVARFATIHLSAFTSALAPTRPASSSEG